MRLFSLVMLMLTLGVGTFYAFQNDLEHATFYAVLAIFFKLDTL